MPDFLMVVGEAGHLDMLELIKQASLVVKLVMLLLAGLSIGSWYIIGYKYFYIKRATKESELFMDSFWRSRDIEQIYKHAQQLRKSPVSQMFLAGYTELAKLASDDTASREKQADLDNVQRALHRVQITESTKLENMTPFLATTGSAGPFIGLFGTVWGIMNSFSSIGAKKSATIATVAPGIAEALFATAIGLIAAIPSVMAYNYFVRRIRVHVAQMNTFEQDYLNIIRRHFLS